MPDIVIIDSQAHCFSRRENQISALVAWLQPLQPSWNPWVCNTLEKQTYIVFTSIIYAACRWFLFVWWPWWNVSLHSALLLPKALFCCPWLFPGNALQARPVGIKYFPGILNGQDKKKCVAWVTQQNNRVVWVSVSLLICPGTDEHLCIKTLFFF